MGISEENLDKLFINFGKLSEHDQINSSGTGLGLSICKELIHQMGGKVSVESKVGKGSTFMIDLQTQSRIKPRLSTKSVNDVESGSSSLQNRRYSLQGSKD